MSSGAKHLAPLPFDRTLIWGILQLLSIIVLPTTILLGFSLGRSRMSRTSSGMENTWLLVGGIVFIPWALYWQLLIP